MTSLSRIAKQVALLGTLLLYGCASGAMRIDVDVYKGPLVQTSDAQFASVEGYLKETKHELVHNLNITLMLAAHHGFLREPHRGLLSSIKHFFVDGGTPTYVKNVAIQDFLRGQDSSVDHDDYLYFPSDGSDFGGGPVLPTINDAVSWCDELDPEGWWDLPMTYASCVMLRSVYIDSIDMLQDVDTVLKRYSELKKLEYIDKRDASRLLDTIDVISERFREKPVRWAKAHMAGVSPDCRTRMAVMSFVLFASESGNQLKARANALRKQLGQSAGIDTNELALSVYLQDVQPTDFVHLFDWFEASADGCGGGDWFRRNILNLIGFPGINVQDRVKVLKRLYADRHWSRINTVHASAPGKGNMVFVKDEIGNWNLKNFESYPGELINAYMNVGKTMLETAAKIGAASSGVGAGGVAVEAAIKFASQAIADSPSTMAGPLLLKELETSEKDMFDRIRTETQKAKQEEEKMTGDSEKVRQARKGFIHRLEKILTSFNDNMDVLKKSGQSEVGAKSSNEDLDVVRKLLGQPSVRP